MHSNNSANKKLTPQETKYSYSRRRITWIDTARGFAIILVILGHTPIPSTLTSYIYSFHVPLFFILSGFLIDNSLSKSFADFFKSKFLRLVIPYLFLAIVNYLYWLLIKKAGLDPTSTGISSAEPLNGIFLAVRNSNFMISDGALWFICALFVSEIAFYMINKLVKASKPHIAMILFAAIVAGSLYNTFINTPLPWSLDTLPFVVSFVGAGYFIKHYYQRYVTYNLRNKIYILVIALSLNLLAWRLNQPKLGRTDMFYSSYGEYLLYFLAAISGSVAVIIFFEVIKYQPKVLTYIGKHSLLIYGFHQKIIFGIIGLVFLSTLHSSFPFSDHTTLEKLANGVVYATLTIILAVPIVKFCNAKLGVFIGQTRTKN